ncbi:hypothetical protein EGW08_021849 [Elysia chlorotica]|uniref:Morc S5 domain-containing protein n=1 Tax=Elysia chlorotica TaxID=188477 RepID=A0A3S1AYC4_ELYCH|nr:hypothetical protein EGW08_021849 [Elysia chlorotica]
MMATCSTATNQDGIQPVGVCPWYLHGNSTPHTWIFGAFAELIDNAYDPDVNAEEFWIDKVDYEGSPCLMFKDNGSGISPDKFLKMFSFGYCEKRRDESYPNHMPIGQYGNGFKSGSMRMGEDAIVFTRTKDSASVGFLSKTYLEAIGSDNLIVPIVHYSLPGMQRCEPRKFENNLKAILTYSVFHSEDALKEELLELETCGTGTKIIISNLKKINNDLLELDFTSDPRDILCPAAQEVEASAVKSRSFTLNPSRYRVSLREYCTILFLKPRMIIHIRGKKVRTKLVSRALREPCYFNYKPHTVKSPIRVTFGFTWGQMETEDYGMMLYNRNRLIKAFERVGCQRQSNTTDGIGVVGVAEINFVEPEHTKQNFTSSTAYNAALRWFGDKLNEYWYEKKYTGTPGQSRQQR